MGRSLTLSDDPLDDLFHHRALPVAEVNVDDDPPELAPDEWEPWLQVMFPAYVSKGFSDYHREYWQWLWSIEDGARREPFVGIWAREGGKSTSIELGVAALGLRNRRGYVWYVRATQDNADDSVTNIGALLESGTVEAFYPSHAQRRVGKYGTSKGWRRNRLHTAGGFIVDAVGLDTIRRGVKVEDKRPDFIVWDDIDGSHDTAQATKKKRQILTKAILPAGAAGVVTVAAVQNLIIPHGIFAQLADGSADFLIDRMVSGPHPAIRDLKTERVFDEELGRVRDVIVSGTPTWPGGQGLAVCQAAIDTEGLTAFKEERQHEVHERTGALWTKATLNECRVMVAPPMKRVVVGNDPSGGGDDIGIIIAGIGYDGTAYVIGDFTAPGSRGPSFWGHETVRAYDEFEADKIVAERNYGGDMVESNIKVAAGDRRVPVDMVTASRGKAVRAEPVASLYTDGLVKHVGTFPELETELTSWVPGDKTSPNRLDALVWCLTELMLTEGKRVRIYSAGSRPEKKAS